MLSKISAHQYPLIFSSCFLLLLSLTLLEQFIVLIGVLFCCFAIGAFVPVLRLITWCLIPFLGMIAIMIVHHHSEQMPKQVAESRILLSGYVQSQEIPDLHRQRLTVIIESSSVSHLVGQEILITSSRYPDVKKGSQIQGSCILEIPEAFDGFHYPRYLASKKIYYLCSRFYLENQKHAAFTLKRILEPARIWIANQVSSLWPKPISSLALGLLLGTRESFPEQTLVYFQRSGITHIIALSGFNITILIVFFERLCINLCISKRLRFYLIVVCIIFFTVFVGAGASITRAAIMGSMAFFSRYSMRLASPMRLMLFTAAIMTALNPFILLYDIGFQLSFLSTLGLVYLTPIFDKLFFFVPKIASIQESLSTTMAATIATLPLILSQFSKLSIISPIANLLILPIIPWLMALSALAVILFSLHPLLSLPVSYLFTLGSQYLLAVSAYSSRLTWAAIDLEFSSSMMWFSYLLLFVLYQYWMRYVEN